MSETVIIKSLVAQVKDHEQLLRQLEKVLSRLAGKDWSYDFQVEDGPVEYTPEPEDFSEN